MFVSTVFGVCVYALISIPKQWPCGSRISVDLQYVQTAADSCCCAVIKDTISREVQTGIRRCFVEYYS